MQDVREIIREKGRWEGERKGRQAGRQEGRQEGIQQVVLNMLKEKINVSVISKVTGLSKEEVENLKNGSE